MKKLVNRYRYTRSYEEIHDEDGNLKFLPHDSYLVACHKKRDYQTKMTLEDLPEYYCDMHRVWYDYDVISAKDIIDIHYSWVKENHFMKDSVIHISYTGKLVPYHQEYTIDGKKVKSIFTDYKNLDEMVFGNEIFKFLAYAHKYSNYDLSEIRSEFIKQCNWLKKNEPEFAPELNDSQTYGDWFDDTIKKHMDYDS